MNFELLRPLYTGDTIVCKVTIDTLGRKNNQRTAIAASFHCTNQHNKEVLQGNFAGVIIYQ